MSDIIDKIKAQGTQASVLMPELAEQINSFNIFVNVQPQALTRSEKIEITLTEASEYNDAYDNITLIDALNNNKNIKIIVKDPTSLKLYLVFNMTGFYNPNIGKHFSASGAIFIESTTGRDEYIAQMYTTSNSVKLELYYTKTLKS